MHSILFVCTANRFRSPLAAACFQRELALRGVEAGWQVSSAGTWTTEALPATPEALAWGKRMDLDLSTHRSRCITASLMKDSDVIIVMEQGQLEALRLEFPRSAQKLHLLSEASTGVAYDIPDPRTPASSDEVPGEIADLIRSGFDRICALVNH